jgi:hypothetical protein
MLARPLAKTYSAKNNKELKREYTLLTILMGVKIKHM